MELKETLKHIVDEYGRKALKSGRLLNLLADLNVSYEYPSMKFILKIMLEEGIVVRLSGAEITKMEADLCLGDITEKYGFQRKVSSMVINSILFAVGKNECFVNDETEIKPINSPKLNNDSHILFSGISLGESVSDIAKYLTTRGFNKKKTESYDIIMSGVFCGIHNVRLCVLGSPHGLTRGIALHFGADPTSMKLDHANKLYDLLKRKYGEPIKFFEKFKIIGIGKDFDYYCNNILLFSEAVENFDTLIDIEWKVDGGTIEMKWFGEAMYLIYNDRINCEYIENHSNEFNISCI